ncbi:MAG: hypothetical protein A3K19_01285 [Lentisphaerae bacterium RIFOXYB12_FULL_65_16]|nr:MAG: hypothetical protein A3K18_33845 [Lentisphaerae bacterium RIFOXYA12_64_32]OGV92522.1 MAG: hypothetical protein A3K19_01285 [Lentisphaerae bacterium RIFOXYB12_FULL_65_16]
MHRWLQTCVWTVLVLWGSLPIAGAEKPAQPQAPTAAPPVLWFDAITGPLALDTAGADVLCRTIYSNLQSGRVDTAALARLDPSGAPRAVFLSWSDGEATARVFFGLGTGLAAAVQSACQNVATSGMPGASLRWLKVDVVQYAYPTGDFVTRESSIPMPSLVGIAFAPQSGFAFLPEQLVGWKLVDPHGNLLVHRIADLFTVAEQFSQLGKWSSISSFSGPQWVTLFECQSYFCDGTRVEPLFRGHRCFGDLTPDVLLAAAGHGGDFLVKWCNDKGLFAVRFPEWQADSLETVAVSDQASAALALLELYEIDKRPETLGGARRALQALLACLKPSGADGKAACLVQDGQAALEANAMALLALLKYGELASNANVSKHVTRLGYYLLRQRQPGGVLVCGRSYPSGKIDPSMSLTGASVAIVAFVRMYEKTNQTVFLDAARESMTWLRAEQVGKRELDALPQDAWFVRALDSVFTYDRDPELVTTTERIALAIMASQTWGFPFPDFLGSINSHPSATLAAQRALALATAARLLHDNDRDIAADKIVADLQTTLAFQLQAQADAPSAMYLPKPQDYLGGFRDHCLDFGFALSCQSAQMFSLLAVYRQAKASPEAALLLTDRYREARQTATAALSRFPRALPSLNRRPGPATQGQGPQATPPPRQQLPDPPPARAVPKR